MPALQDIFSIWDSIADAAREFDVPYYRVAKWHQRGSIPSAFWPQVIAAAERKGRKVTADELMRLTASREGERVQ
jgi:hypothetical protein